MDIQPSSLYLGIDTGGTFTDGVLLDPQTRQVVRARKVLTTHQDLKICIAQILDQILPKDPSAISLVSLSTTLATNAIAEGKRKPVALLLLGYDRELVHQYNFHKQFGTPAYFFIEGRYSLEGVEEIPLDEEEIVRIAHQVRNEVDVFAVSSLAGPINTRHEERAAEILSGLTRLPVIQAHHLSSELDSIRRATTVSLNASLLADIQEFLEAVEDMLAQKGLHCPVMIVRGDGSIVKASFARQRPVEIIHSGPATSALGGQFLADANSALVVDMGGTTTDVCLVERGTIQAMQNAATIGPYRTCVRTIKACSFGLGGDSLIRFDHHRTLAIGPERVLPISHLCAEYPEIQGELAFWLKSKNQLYYSDGLEYWVMRREPKREITHAPTQKALTILRSGPQRMRKLIEEVGVKSPLLLDVDELVNQGIIERAGLTPTDLLHVTGEFSPWNAEIAQLLAGAAAKIWNEDAMAFTQRIKDWMTRKITTEIIQYLSHKTLSERAYNLRGDDLDRWFFEENLSDSDPYLGCKISLKVPIVGIGAPAGIFLPAVAQALGTDCILPNHYEVANAVGTVVGNVIIRKEGSVFPCVEGIAITGYFARVDSCQEKFPQYDRALAFAREKLTGQVRAEAEAAGACPVMVECEVKEGVAGMANLLAWAVGRPGVDGRQSNPADSKSFALA
jgi:N-methylhydantoinase A/oxoprolinase/acetone carboxylase beta subunit